MKMVIEIFRAVFISPEAVAASLPFAILLYSSEPATFAAQQLASDIKWAIGTAVIPLGMLVTTYAFGSEILSPSGVKKALLVWPDYWKLKMRIVIALGFCLLGFIFVICGVYMVAHQNLVWGATNVIAGLLSAASALASVALAKWNIREILPD
jgi:hypothetical protein